MERMRFATVIDPRAASRGQWKYALLLSILVTAPPVGCQGLTSQQQLGHLQAENERLLADFRAAQREQQRLEAENRRLAAKLDDLQRFAMQTPPHRASSPNAVAPSASRDSMPRTSSPTDVDPANREPSDGWRASARR